MPPPTNGMLREPCLVTGATGFLGRSFLAFWKDRMPEITASSRRPVEGVRFQIGDLTDPSLTLGPHRYAVVYHMAGRVHAPSRRSADARAFFEVNLQGTLNLLSALERSGTLPGAFVFVSTA